MEELEVIYLDGSRDKIPMNCAWRYNKYGNYTGTGSFDIDWLNEIMNKKGLLIVAESPSSSVIVERINSNLIKKII